MEAVTKASEREGFRLECGLNGKSNQKFLCDLYCSGNKAKDIAERMGVESVELVCTFIIEQPEYYTPIRFYPKSFVLIFLLTRHLV